MPPNKSNDKSAYKSKLKLYLEKLKNGEVQATKVDLTKIKINTLAKKVGALSEDVKMYMYLCNSKRYYALNDRRINLLMKGTIGMSATTCEIAEVITDSDQEVVDLINVEQEAELFTVEKNKTRAGGSFSHILILVYLVYLKMAFLKSVARTNYKHNCVYLALESGGLSVIKL